MSDLRPGAHRNETAAERSVRRASEARAQRKEQSVALRKDKRAKHMELKRTRRAPPMDAILQSNVMAGSPESSGSSANCAVPIAADATGEHTAMDDIDLDNDISDEELDITVKSLVDTLRKFKEATRQRTLGVIGDYLQRGSRYVEAYIRHDIKLGAMLRALNTPQTQLQACWCISNIAASISSHTREASVASPYLITFLGSENAYLQDHSATAVANIAGDSPSCRDQLIAQGAISPVISLIASRSADVVRSAAFALSNLLRGQALDLRQRMNATLMPAMIKAFETFVAQSNYDVITELLWTRPPPSVRTTTRCLPCCVCWETFSEALKNTSASSQLMHRCYVHCWCTCRPHCTTSDPSVHGWWPISRGADPNTGKHSWREILCPPWGRCWRAEMLTCNGRRSLRCWARHITTSMSWMLSFPPHPWCLQSYDCCRHRTSKYSWQLCSSLRCCVGCTHMVFVWWMKATGRRIWRRSNTTRTKKYLGE
eukprot:m.437166 g.437166  ORF g.437166 m.437166 type:complete len:486 (+) comp21433_c0_seq8:238-1695(+)